MHKTYILIYRHIPIEIADQFLGSSNKRCGSFYKTSDWRMKFKPNTTNCCFIVGINFVIINWCIGSLKKRLLEFTLELLGCNDFCSYFFKFFNCIIYKLFFSTQYRRHCFFVVFWQGWQSVTKFPENSSRQKTGLQLITS